MSPQTLERSLPGIKVQTLPKTKLLPEDKAKFLRIQQEKKLSSKEYTLVSEQPQMTLIQPETGPFDRVIKEARVKRNTNITFLPTGKASLEKELDIIKNPTKNPQTGEGHVYVQSFTFDADNVGLKFVGALKDATEKNPKVAYGFLVDHIFAVRGGFRKARAVREMLTDLKTKGVQVVVTNFFNFLGIHENPFHRNHQKIASDGTRAVLTTANITEEHTRWADIGLLFEGPVAKIIDDVVDHTFGYARRWRRVYDTTNPIDYVQKYGPLPRGTDILGAVVRNADDRGQKITVKSDEGQEIEILTDSFYKPYQEATNAAFAMIEHAPRGAIVDIFTPYPGMYTLTKKMLEARKNGAIVNLHIPSKNDYVLYNPDAAPPLLRPFIRHQQKVWKEKLKTAGVTLYEFIGDKGSEGMAHAKAVKISYPDKTGRLWLGSSNLNKGLFAGSNREIAVVLSDENVLKEFNNFLIWYRGQAEVFD